MKTIDYYNQYADEFTQTTLNVDTVHNFVLAYTSCNSKKSNLLASDEFLPKWYGRNEEQDLIIVDKISVLGFLTDKERSYKVAEWAYAQGKENNYLMWNG